jgi:hypothetical protein
MNQQAYQSPFPTPGAEFIHQTLNSHGFFVDLSNPENLSRLKASLPDLAVFMETVKRLAERPDDTTIFTQIKSVIHRAGIPLFNQAVVIPGSPAQQGHPANNGGGAQTPQANTQQPHGKPVTPQQNAPVNHGPNGHSGGQSHAPQGAGNVRNFPNQQNGGHPPSNPGPQQSQQPSGNNYAQASGASSAGNKRANGSHSGQPSGQGQSGVPSCHPVDENGRVLTYAVVPANDRGNVIAALSNPRRLNQHTAYGGQHAVQLEADLSRSHYNVCAFDFASGSNKNFNWDDKLRMQITRIELPQVLAVFLGILPSVEFKNHGESNDKGFRVEAAREYDRQTKKESGRPNFKIKGFAKGRMHAIQVPLEDAYQFTSILTRQMLADNPGLDAPGLYAMLRAIYGRLGQDMQDQWYAKPQQNNRN